MTTRDSFTDEEWALLTQATTSACTAITMSDATVVSLFKEMSALGRKLAQGKDTYQSNELLQAVLAHKQEAQKSQGGEAPLPEEAVVDSLNKVGQVAKLLDEKATSVEAEQFKQFLYEIGVEVANASGEGWLGFGKKVSDREEEGLEKLKTALGI